MTVTQVYITNQDKSVRNRYRDALNMDTMQLRTLLFVVLIATVNGEAIQELKPAASSHIIEERQYSEKSCSRSDIFILRLKGARTSGEFEGPTDNLSSCTLNITCAPEKEIPLDFTVTFSGPYGMSMLRFVGKPVSINFRPRELPTTTQSFDVVQNKQITVKKAEAGFEVDCIDRSTRIKKVEGYLKGTYTEVVVECKQK